MSTLLSATLHPSTIKLISIYGLCKSVDNSITRCQSSNTSDAVGCLPTPLGSSVRPTISHSYFHPGDDQTDPGRHSLCIFSARVSSQHKPPACSQTSSRRPSAMRATWTSQTLRCPHSTYREFNFEFLSSSILIRFMSTSHLTEHRSRVKKEMSTRQ